MSTPQLHFGAEQPFGRRVTITLNNALAACHRAVQAVITRGELSVFDDAVQAGVSSNLCNAISSVRDSSLNALLEVNFAWATLRDHPSPDRGAKHVFGPDALDILQSAATYLRDREDEILENQKLFGYVTQCDRGATEDSGTIVLQGLAQGLEDRERIACRIELSGEAYVKATRAHGGQKMVLVVGTLQRTGTRWFMNDVDTITEYDLESQEQQSEG